MFLVKQIKVTDFSDEKTNLKSIKTFICYKNSYGNLEPHIFSKYIELNFSSYALNTQKKYAEEIKKFLNFLSLNGKNDVSKIVLKDGADYISYLGRKYNKGEISSNTLIYSERRIIHFFDWLSQNKVIKEPLNITKRELNKNDSKIVVYNTPFRRLDLKVAAPQKNQNNAKNRLHDFGPDRNKYITEFVNLVELYEPEILPGVILQIFGGLRAGEVSNIRFKDVKLSPSNSNIPSRVLIRDSWEEELNKDIKISRENILDIQVKEVREQLIISTRKVFNVLEKQIEKIKKKYRDYENRPLIFNYKNGNSLSGQMYRKRFNKVRDIFLNGIRARDRVKYEFLKQKKWSTHICRGIYTNILHFDLKLTVSEIRVLRGDKSLKSLQDYLEEINATHRLNEVIEILDRKLVFEFG